MRQPEDLPPHDAHAERCLIGAVVFAEMSADLDEVQQLVGPDDFYVQSGALVMRAALKLHQAREHVDLATVHGELGRMGRSDDVPLEFLQGCVESIPYAAGWETHAKTVRELAIRRRLIQASTDAIRAAHDRGHDLDELLHKTESGHHLLIEQRLGSELSDGASIENVCIELMDHLSATTAIGVSTGIGGFDDITGGVSPGQLVCIAARPSVGKTAIATGFALHAAENGTPVLFFSLEMSRLELVMRMVSMKSGVSVERIQRREYDDDERDRIVQASSDVGQLPLFIEDRARLTVGDVAAISRIRRRRNGVGMVVIDYLALLTPTDRKLPREEQLAGQTRELKTLAKDLQCPIVMLAQMNRAIEQRGEKSSGPQLSDLRGSGAIEADSDIVCFLDRHPKCRESITLVIAKHRNGRVGNVSLRFDGERMCFKQETSADYEVTDWGAQPPVEYG